MSSSDFTQRGNTVEDVRALVIALILLGSYLGAKVAAYRAIFRDYWGPQLLTWSTFWALTEIKFKILGTGILCCAVTYALFSCWNWLKRVD